ncbi:MAG: DsbA family protein [Devosiaceae bacterium]|nr:DsbA family protein [Devosiaceae bacterium]
MSKPNMVLVAVSAALFGALAMFLLNPAPSMNSDEAIRTLVGTIIDEREAKNTAASQQISAAQTAEISSPDINPEILNPMIENFLMDDPKILQRVSIALQEQLRLDEVSEAKIALVSFESEIYDDPDHVVLGNPDGDVTLVEFFDYNCVFCRAAMPDVARLLAEDQNLRVIFKEYPILSEDSVNAARVAIAVSKTPGADYWAFHELLYTARGQISGETALATAQSMGMNRVELELAAMGADVTDIIQKSYILADGLKISGTPAFIIGDEIIPGAVGYERLRDSIANVRKCGSTVCNT